MNAVTGMRIGCSLIILLPILGLHAQDVAHARSEEGTANLFREGEKAYRNGDHTAAVGLFTRVLEQDPEHLNAYLQRGFCHSLQKNYAAAVADFTAVVERKSDHLWAYTSRGSAYSKLGRYDLAMRDFDTVIGLDPRNEEAYNNRGWARRSMGDGPGACKDWKTSKKLGNAEAAIILENNRCK